MGLGWRQKLSFVAVLKAGALAARLHLHHQPVFPEAMPVVVVVVAAAAAAAAACLDLAVPLKVLGHWRHQASCRGDRLSLLAVRAQFRQARTGRLVHTRDPR